MPRDRWPIDTTQGNQLQAVAFLDEIFSKHEGVRKALSHRGAVRIQKEGIKEVCALVKARQKNYTFNTFFVEIHNRMEQRDNPQYFCYKDVGNAVMGKVYDRG